MVEPFLGEIRVFAGTFAPVGWVFCDGQLLPISENDALYVLLGTAYGGDGITTFGVPDLRGRVPVHQGQLPGGSTYVMGAPGGAEEVTLTANQLPAHTHPARATSAPDRTSPQDAIWSSQTTGAYRAADASVTMNPQTVQPAGGSQPHDNMPPTLTVSYIIAVSGIFPSRP